MATVLETKSANDDSHIRGSVSEEQRQAVENWLKARSELAVCEVGPLQDAWYPDKPINAAV